LPVEKTVIRYRSRAKIEEKQAEKSDREIKKILGKIHPVEN